MSDDEFLLPGLLDPVWDGDPHTLHQAGLDRLQLMYDPADIHGDTQDIGVETPAMRRRQHMPQAGPNFVAAVHQQISEVDRKLNSIREDMLSRWSFQPTAVVFIAGMQTNASGVIDLTTNANAFLFEPPPGFTMALHRVTVKVNDATLAAAGSNFGNPFNVALGFWELRINGDMVDGGSLVSGAGSFPAVRTWGTRDAIRIRDGEVLSLYVNGTATLANKSLLVRGQGTYDRTAEG